MIRHALGLLLASTATWATTPSPAHGQPLEVGFTTGLTVSTFRGDVDDPAYRTGFTGGLTLGYPVGDRLEISTGLSWVQKGAEGTVSGFEEPLDASLRLEYLEIPLMVRGSLPTGTTVRPTLLVGGTVAFETACESESPPTSSFLSVIDCHSQGRREQTDWSLLLGAGAAATLGPASVELELRYHHGLVNLRGRGSSFEVENRTVAIVAGIRVPVRLGR